MEVQRQFVKYVDTVITIVNALQLYAAVKSLTIIFRDGLYVNVVGHPRFRNGTFTFSVYNVRYNKMDPFLRKYIKIVVRRQIKYCGLSIQFYYPHTLQQIFRSSIKCFNYIPVHFLNCIHEALDRCHSTVQNVVFEINMH